MSSLVTASSPEPLQIIQSYMKESCPDSKLKTLLRNSTGCRWVAVSGKELGRGQYGFTFQVCCNNTDDCMYVAKVQLNRMHATDFETKVNREIAMQQRFYELGLAPEIIDAWSCEHEFIMIMPKMDMTLKAYLMSLLGKLPLSDVLSINRDIQQQVLSMIEKAHQRNLIHNDLHVDNIMVDVDSRGLNWVDVKLIDFGKSRKVSSPVEADRLEGSSDIVLTFDLMESTLKDVSAQKGRGVVSKVPAAPVKGRNNPLASPIYRPPSTAAKTLLLRTPVKEYKTPEKSPKKTLRFQVDDDEDEVFFSTPKKRLF